jgi:lysophospholipase L1-like esterase
MVKMLGFITGMSLFWAAARDMACSKRHEDLMMAAPAVGDTTTGFSAGDSLSYLALGDSYTIGQSVEESDRYPAQVTGLLRGQGLPYRDPVIIATTGWTTGNLLGATPVAAPGPPYHVVTLLIGVNNQYQHRTQSEYAIDMKTLVERAVKLAGNNASHVILLSIPDYSVTTFAAHMDRAAIAAEIDSLNIINKQAALDHGTQWLDVTAESRKAATDASLVASDGLHFSGKEYAVWAAMLAPLMKALKVKS